jgi:hypothetical protein
MKNKRLIAVLGMHRSGSSAITKGLEVLGVDLGSHLMAADANNAKGYFEDVAFNQLNTAILRANGQDWYSLSYPNKDDFTGDKFTPLKERAIELLQGKFEKTDLLGIKDPRLCRLLPFWKDVFDALDLDVAYVIILRDPESIAASLFSRDALPRVKSLYLWLEHMLPAFQETLGCSRCVVNYDQLVSDPEAVIERLADKLDLRERLDQRDLQAYVTEFIDARLKHHHGKPTSETGFTSELTRQLASLLDNVSGQGISIDSPEFNCELDLIDQAYRDRKDILAYIDTLDAIIIAKQRELVETGKRLDALSTAYNEAVDAREHAQKAIAGRDLQIEGLKTNIEEKDEQLDSLRQILDERNSIIESLELSLTDHHAQIEASKQRIKALERQHESSVSNSENLALQLDEIHSSYFWRTSIISRKVWAFLESVFKLKKEICQAIPLTHLERVMSRDHSWLSTGNDPCFRLIPISGAMPAGWVRINAYTMAEPRERIFKLYSDFGGGFSEDTALEIPVSPTGMVDEIVHFSGDLKSIRWDPMDHAGEFKLEPVSISRINWLIRILRMSKRVASIFLDASPELRKESGLSWKKIILNLSGAYEITRAIIISRNEQV